MHWSPRLSGSVVANMTNPAGSTPTRASQGLTAALAESQNMSITHSRQGSKLAMPQVDREHFVMPHPLSSPRAVPQSLNSPEAQHAKLYSRPTLAASTSVRGSLQRSPEPVPKGEAFSSSHDSLIRAKHSGLYASLQDAGNMASSAEARGVSGSPTQAGRPRMVSAGTASPSHEREPSKERGAGGEVVPTGDHAERELWSKLQAAQQKVFRGELTPKKQASLWSAYMIDQKYDSNNRGK